MPKRHTDSRFFQPALSFAVGVLLVTGASLLPTDAKAGQLDGLTGPVSEIAAPVEAVVEQAVPPVTGPAPAPQPTVVQVPEVEVPQVPVELPPVRLPEAAVKPPVPQVAETVTKTVAAARNAATSGTETAAATGGGAAERAPSAAGDVTDAARRTIASATAATDVVLTDPAAAAAPGAAAAQRGAPEGATASESTAAGGSAPPAAAGATTAPRDVPSMVFPGFPARVLRPFIRVWPAVALLAEGPLGAFVGNWSRSVRALFAAGRSGGPASSWGEASPLAAPPPAATAAEQPPFSRPPSPALAPFNWVRDDSPLIALALFLALGASTLAVLALGRRELGLPMFRRGHRFPWSN